LLLGAIWSASRKVPLLRKPVVRVIYQAVGFSAADEIGIRSQEPLHASDVNPFASSRTSLGSHCKSKRCEAFESTSPDRSGTREWRMGLQLGAV
jgi:hypothetical protein